jgi:cytochrome c5
MRLHRILIWGLIALGATLMQAQKPSTSTEANPPANAKKAAANSTQQNPGERKFQENCGRCHTAPEELPPSITGTVVRHMRVRASLSAKDEQDILRYLAP